MSRGKRERPRAPKPAVHPGGARSQPSSARRANRWPVFAAFAAAIAVAIAAWFAARTFRPTLPAAPASAPVAPAEAAMPLDSVAIVAAWHQAANTRNDWPEALRLARRLAATLPKHPLAIRQLALAEHNLRNPVPSGRSAQRYLLRNSLEWAAAEQAAVALLDSSAALATTPADRARALFWRGRVLEFEGALLDALAAYEAALRADPSDSASGRAAAQVVANLRASSTPAR